MTDEKPLRVQVAEAEGYTWRRSNVSCGKPTWYGENGNCAVCALKVRRQS